MKRQSLDPPFLEYRNTENLRGTEDQDIYSLNT